MTYVHVKGSSCSWYFSPRHISAKDSTIPWEMGIMATHYDNETIEFPEIRDGLSGIDTWSPLLCLDVKILLTRFHRRDIK